MRTSVVFAGAAALVLLAGCEKAEAPAPSKTATTDVPVESAAPETPLAGDAAAAPHRFSNWAGKWSGIEGMYATITPAEPGKYKLEMQSDLDTKGIYDGEDSEHGIKFKRGSEELTLRAGSGDETGLKNLAGKKQCLIVKQGEGYCRD